MENLFYFNTKAQANKFDKECRKHFILVENVTPYVMRIHNFDNIKDEYKQSTINTTKNIYSSIMG